MIPSNATIAKFIGLLVVLELLAAPLNIIIWAWIISTGLSIIP
jgi:hypothetical protein